MAADRRKVLTRGIYEFLDDDTNRVRITELPVGVWTKDYKAFLEELAAGEGTAAPRAAKGGAGGSDAGSSTRLVKSFQEAYNDVDVEFIVTLDPEYYHEARTFPAEFEKKFRLVNSTSLNNMVAFDADGHIRRFASAGEILETFYVKRIGGYVARKANELARMDAEIVELDARVRFVRAVVTGALVVANAEDAALLAGLKALSLPPLSAPEDGNSLKAYEYLLRMRVDRLKAAAVAELEAQLAAARAERDTLAAKSAEDLWLTDLDVFSEAYERFLSVRMEARAATAAESVGAKAPAKKKVVRKAKVAGK
jgi:DNA topoisomerase-2